MRVYKFLNSKHVDSLLSGHLRLGSIESFRMMDAPQWIADRTEGTSTGLADISISSDHPDFEKVRTSLGQNRFVQFAPDATFKNFKMANNSFTYLHPPVHLWCSSMEPFEAARKAMCEDAPEEYRYDACVLVEDIELFVKNVGRTGSVDGRPLGDFIRAIKGSAVKYTKKIYDLTAEVMPPANPFEKPAEYESQNEFRILFGPKGVLPDVVSVKFRPDDGLLKQVSVAPPSA